MLKRKSSKRTRSLDPMQAELEDHYYTLFAENINLKKQLNSQEQELKVLSTRLRRMIDQQKIHGHDKCHKQCCEAFKAVIEEQKSEIYNIQMVNEKLTECMRQLNMKLNTARYFMKRSSITPRPHSCNSKPPPQKPQPRIQSFVDKPVLSQANQSKKETNVRPQRVCVDNIDQDTKDNTRVKTLSTDTDQPQKEFHHMDEGTPDHVKSQTMTDSCDCTTPGSDRPKSPARSLDRRVPGSARPKVRSHSCVPYARSPLRPVKPHTITASSVKGPEPDSVNKSPLGPVKAPMTHRGGFGKITAPVNKIAPASKTTVPTKSVKGYQSPYYKPQPSPKMLPRVCSCRNCRLRAQDLQMKKGSDANKMDPDSNKRDADTKDVSTAADLDRYTSTYMDSYCNPGAIHSQMDSCTQPTPSNSRTVATQSPKEGLPMCDNKCSKQILELKRKIVSLQKELSSANEYWTNKRLESQPSSKVHGVTCEKTCQLKECAKWREEQRIRSDLDVDLAVAKSKITELETDLKARDIDRKASETLQGVQDHLIRGDESDDASLKEFLRFECKCEEETEMWYDKAKSWFGHGNKEMVKCECDKEDITAAAKTWFKENLSRVNTPAVVVCECERESRNHGIKAWVKKQMYGDRGNKSLALSEIQRDHGKHEVSDMMSANTAKQVRRDYTKQEPNMVSTDATQQRLISIRPQEPTMNLTDLAQQNRSDYITPHKPKVMSPSTSQQVRTDNIRSQEPSMMAAEPTQQNRPDYIRPEEIDVIPDSIERGRTDSMRPLEPNVDIMSTSASQLKRLQQPNIKLTKQEERLGIKPQELNMMSANPTQQNRPDYIRPQETDVISTDATQPDRPDNIRPQQPTQMLKLDNLPKQSILSKESPEKSPKSTDQTPTKLTTNTNQETNRSFANDQDSGYNDPEDDNDKELLKQQLRKRIDELQAQLSSLLAAAPSKIRGSLGATSTPIRDTDQSEELYNIRYESPDNAASRAASNYNKTKDDQAIVRGQKYDEAAAADKSSEDSYGIPKTLSESQRYQIPGPIPKMMRKNSTTLEKTPASTVAEKKRRSSKSENVRISADTGKEPSSAGQKDPVTHTNNQNKEDYSKKRKPNQAGVEKYKITDTDLGHLDKYENAKESDINQIGVNSKKITNAELSPKKAQKKNLHVIEPEDTSNDDTKLRKTVANSKNVKSGNRRNSSPIEKVSRTPKTADYKIQYGDRNDIGDDTVSSEDERSARRLETQPFRYYQDTLIQEDDMSQMTRRSDMSAQSRRNFSRKLHNEYSIARTKAGRESSPETIPPDFEKNIPRIGSQSHRYVSHSNMRRISIEPDVKVREISKTEERNHFNMRQIDKYPELSYTHNATDENLEQKETGRSIPTKLSDAKKDLTKNIGQEKSSQKSDFTNNIKPIEHSASNDNLAQKETGRSNPVQILDRTKNMAMSRGEGKSPLRPDYTNNTTEEKEKSELSSDFTNNTKDENLEQKETGRKVPAQIFDRTKNPAKSLEEGKFPLRSYYTNKTTAEKEKSSLRSDNTNDVADEDLEQKKTGRKVPIQMFDRTKNIAKSLGQGRSLKSDYTNNKTDENLKKNETGRRIPTQIFDRTKTMAKSLGKEKPRRKSDNTTIEPVKPGKPLSSADVPLTPNVSKRNPDTAQGHSDNDNTDREISFMTDLSLEKDSRWSPRSPGEKNTTTSLTTSPTHSTSATVPTDRHDQEAYSEGELPQHKPASPPKFEVTVKEVRSEGERSDVPLTSSKMELTLQAIAAELAMCQQMLRQTQQAQAQSQEPGASPSTADPPSAPRRSSDPRRLSDPSRPSDSSIALHRVQPRTSLNDVVVPRCIFTLHVGTIVLSDEAVMASRAMALVLTWQFHEQSVSMARMRPGRVVHFDFSTEYDVKITDEFVNYLKYDTLTINICEISNQQAPFASCSLPLRRALKHPNQRVDNSLALMAGPRLMQSRGATDALDAGDEVGVIDLWCMLRADPKWLPDLHHTTNRKINCDPEEVASETNNNRKLIHLKYPSTNTDAATQNTVKVKQSPGLDDQRNSAGGAVSSRQASPTEYLINDVPTHIRSSSEMRKVIQERLKEKYDTPEVGKHDDVRTGRKSLQREESQKKFKLQRIKSLSIHQPPKPQTSASSEPDHIDNKTLDITIQWLALNEECDVMTNPRVQQLYVAYSFLGRSGAELETPMSLPKPKRGSDKCNFNFKKTFQLTDADLPALARIARLRAPSKGLPEARDCVPFTVVSEPVEDPLGLSNCEDVGYAYLYLGDVLAYSGGSNSYTEAVSVRGTRVDQVCGVLTVRVDGLDMVRKCMMVFRDDR